MALLTLGALALGGPAAGQATPGADELVAILQDAALARFGGNAVSRLALVITSPGGGEKTRELALALRRDGEAMRVRGEITAPAALAGTRFALSATEEERPEVLLFLPALGSVTRLAGRRRAESFMGSDFAFEDLAPMDLAGAAHRVIEDVADAWVVETTAGPASESAYHRVVSTISKADHLPRAVAFFDDAGDQIKALDILEVDSEGLPRVLQMRDLKRGSSTRMEIRERRLEVPSEELPLSLFTRDGLREPALQ